MRTNRLQRVNCVEKHRERAITRIVDGDDLDTYEATAFRVTDDAAFYNKRLPSETEPYQESHHGARDGKGSLFRRIIRDRACRSQ